MASKAIEPEIDAYGTYARASNLADYLELLAITGSSPKISDLADKIADESWTTKLQELFTTGEEPPRGEFDDDEPEDASGLGNTPGMTQARRVFDVLDERAQILRDEYPFDVVDGQISLQAGIDIANSKYVGLLAITTAHAHRLDVAVDPKRVLEDTVVRTLAAIGLIAVNVGETAREADDFRQTVMTAGLAVELRPTPVGVMAHARANEQGVDALGHLYWRDKRPGEWVVIGQVTCGKSDTWEGKLGEPKPPSWKKLLNLGVTPLAFLAVPHHVEPRHLTQLVQDADRLVLDRLRLAQFCGDLTDDERRILQAVRDCEFVPVASST